MKSINLSALLGLAVVLVLSSCSMEKRVHMSGYHIEWKKGKNDINKESVASKENKAKNDVAEENKLVVADYSATESEIVEVQNPLEETVADNSVVASNDNNIELPAKKSVSFFSQDNTEKVSANAEAPVIVKQKSEKTKAKKTNPFTNSGKSQVIALILVIVVGTLGIHRFYLGYTTIGIIQLLTLGGCGIWALIDLVRIITGDLQPKDGSYDKTL